MERLECRRPQVVYEIDPFSFMNAKLDTLARKLNKMGVQNVPPSPIVVCEIFGNRHTRRFVVSPVRFVLLY